MKRRWVGVALLAGSWLFGLQYYDKPDYLVWAICILAGWGLLCGGRWFDAGRLHLGIAAALLVPAVWIAPWPYRAIPLLMLLGVLLSLVPVAAAWPRAVAAGGITGGTVLLVQSVVLFLYERITARSHELPGLAAWCMGKVAELLDIDAGVAGNTVSIGSMRKVFPFGATWELLLDPVTLCFLAGGAAMLAIRAGAAGVTSRRDLLKQMGWLALAVAVWLPLRLGLNLGVFLQRVLLTAYEERLELMDQFFSAWMHLLWLAGPVLLAWRWTGEDLPAPKAAVAATTDVLDRRRCGAAALAAAAAVAFTFGIFWDPVGVRKEGRLMVDEAHGTMKDGKLVTWEPTGRPMDTTWYGHLSGYNYACIYDYLSRFYRTSRITEPITDALLKKCDVLMIKTPTGPFRDEEIAAIRRWVDRGGGLFLIGEHTNVFGTGQYLNDIARHYGFTFRYDCLFGIDSVFEEYFVPGLAAHPVLAHMPPMDFAVSCSIAPGASDGRAVIVGTGLKNIMADYHASNFYPQVEDRADSRWGAFVQAWAVRSGKGRVLAFTDSTIWSNFSAFEPGKIELLMGSVEWLNHRNTGIDPRWPLLLCGLVLAGGALYLARGWRGGWLVLTGAGLCGWALSAEGVAAVHRLAMPPRANERSLVRVVMDRTFNDIILPKNGFIAGKPDGYGIFERWILRVGYFIARRAGAESFRDSNLVIHVNPVRTVDNDYRRRMIEYVRNGGHVLVLDNAENRKSTANTLLKPFGLAFERGGKGDSGVLKAAGWPDVPVNGVIPVKFAEYDEPAITARSVFATLNGRPVGATVKFGKGSVTAVGFGARFNDASMGVTPDLIPDQNMRRIFECEYRLLRQIIEGPSATQQAIPDPLPVEGEREM